MKTKKGQRDERYKERLKMSQKKIQGKDIKKYGSFESVLLAEAVGERFTGKGEFGDGVARECCKY